MSNDTIEKKIGTNQLIISKKLMKMKNKVVFLKSIPQTGKTTILKKLFDLNDDKIKIFVTGCDPKNMNFVNNSILFEINSCIKENTKEKISIFFDEYYNDKILDYFKKNKLSNVSIYISTNKLSKKINNDFEVIDLYEDIFMDLDKLIMSKYALDISKKIQERSISIVELISIINFLNSRKKHSHYSVDEILLLLKDHLKKKESERFLPTTTAILCINKNYQMLKTFEFEK